MFIINEYYNSLFNFLNFINLTDSIDSDFAMYQMYSTDNILISLTEVHNVKIFNYICSIFLFFSYASSNEGFYSKIVLFSFICYQL